MIGTELIVAGCALSLALAAGLVVHEWSHALALRLAGVEYSVEFFPDRSDGVLGALASCPWALVRPQPTGGEPPWVLRAAALMPVTLTLPVVALALAGHLPTTDHVVAMALVVGWLACAVPSPQDFSVVWHAHRVLEELDAPVPQSSARGE